MRSTRTSRCTARDRGPRPGRAHLPELALLGTGAALRVGGLPVARVPDQRAAGGVRPACPARPAARLRPKAALPGPGPGPG